MSAYPYKRRRTATSVFAGDFDPRPSRDVLTSLLNGVPTPKPTEEEQEARRVRKREKKEQQREKRDRDEKKRAKAAAKAAERPAAPVAPSATAPPTLIGAPKAAMPIPRATTSSFWQARPQITIPTLHRSASFSPPPMPSSPPTTPGPSMSISSRTSATSSKRPYTPYDDEDIDGRDQSVETEGTEPRKERKKRTAARKGWKGWVEGSPPPSEKLINLDVATILPERKTRSGKNFDAIGVGKEGWV